MYKNVMRYEDKFEFSLYMHGSVRNSILASSYRFAEIYKPRKINNIYLDTPSLTNYYDNLNGLMNRTKHRIRWYGHEHYVNKPIMEYKIKQGVLGYKEFFALPEFDINDFDYDKYLVQIADMYDDDFENFSNLYGEICSSIPSLNNSYMREYYMSADKLIRITIDWDLKYYKPMCGSLCSMEETDDRIIVEVKYDNQHIDKAAMAVQSLGVQFRKISNSKYSTGISRLYFAC